MVLVTLKVGVIGAGLMGQLHARIYQALPETELVGIVELNEIRHDELRELFGVPVYGTPEELWAQVDAVSVCTPDDLRRSVILPAFEHGVRVLVEKPLATGVQEGRELLAARPDPSYLMVGHVLRFDPRIEQARSVLAGGDLGDLWSVRCWRSNSTAIGTRISVRTSVDWFLGIHDVDMVRHVTGREIVRVRADGWSRFTQRRDLVRGELLLDDGTPVQAAWSWILPPQRGSGLQAGLEVIGSEGMLEVDLSHNDVAVTSASAGRQAFLDTYHWPPESGSPGGDLMREIRSFASAALREEAPAITGEDGLRAVAVIAAVEEAVLSGEMVEVDP
jgi:UDP-N-acetylglucosamine 3-dehydrogenase